MSVQATSQKTTLRANDLAFTQRLVTAAVRVGRAGLIAGVAGYIALFVMLGWSNLGPNVYSHTVTLQLMFVVPLALYMSWLLRSRRLPGPTPLDWCALGLFMAYAISIATSVNPRVSLEASLLIGAAVIAYYMVHDVRSLSIRFWARMFMVVTALMCVVALLTVVIQYMNWLSQVEAVKGSLTTGDLIPPDLYRIRMLRNHPSAIAMFLNIALPFVAARAVIGGRTERTIAIAIILLGATTVFFSLTRGAWMGTMAWTVVFAAALMLRTNRLGVIISAITERLSQHRSKLLWLAGASLCFAVVVAFVALQAQPAWLFRPTLDDRFEAAGTAIAIFRDHWLTGAGPYTFLLLDDLYSDHAAGSIIIVHPHNVYLQVLSEVGVVGATVILLGVVVLFRSMAAAWSRSDRSDRLYVAASFSATVAVMVHGLVDAPPVWNTVLVPFAVAIALTIRLAPRMSTPRLSLAKLPARIATLALMPLLLFAWVGFDIAHNHYSQSLWAYRNGDVHEAAAEASKAADSNDRLFAYALHAGVMNVSSYLQTLEAGYDNRESLTDGIAHLRRATELDPHSSLAYANLSIAYRIIDDRENAVSAARSAIADGPGDDNLYAVAGTTFEWAGLRDEAVAAYASAIQFEPTLTQALFWASTPDRMALRLDAINAAGLDACVIGRSAAVFGLYEAGLSQLASECAQTVEQTSSPAAQGQYALILAALGSQTEAREQAAMAISAAPADKEALLASALILAETESETRYELLKAYAASNRDAIVLLAATYDPHAGTSDGLTLLGPRTSEVLPQEIAVLLEARPDLQSGRGASRRGRIYYYWGAAREAPAISLIPAEWSTLVSPRALLSSELSTQAQ